MDMKINSTKIIELRRQHAWSQQQLADIACVSMRTIQRIESSKHASQDSIKAIASAFEINVQDLLEDNTAKKFNIRLKLIATLLLAGSFISSMFFIGSANAQSLMIKVQITSSDQHTDVKLFQDSGQKSEMIFGEEFKLEITPNILDDNTIHINTKIFELNKIGGAKLIASPSVMTEHQSKATIKFGTANNAHYELYLTPLL